MVVCMREQTRRATSLTPVARRGKAIKVKCNTRATTKFAKMANGHGEKRESYPAD